MTSSTTSSSRAQILARVRTALADGPAAPLPSRDYFASHTPDDPAAILDLLHENLADYRAIVHRTAESELPTVIARLLEQHDAASVAVPAGLPAAWLSGAKIQQRHDVTAGLEGDGVSSLAPSGSDRPAGEPLTPYELDTTDAVVTGCAVAIAETGTIVLDAGPGQGRRALTLVPDIHICVVRAADQVVASVPQSLPHLDPTRPQTWISGPSATSDIELDRVEGVHGPRTLHVVLVTDE
ncbi:lactate utilization protein C [Streptomyces populi]|uniref:Lactate utilization protein C n=1 Tax=Streptomyces populi TaxID=2058924 RepID=A0A2I0SQT7_9ACTN|nr:lactate utilization protein C [Streptomyces populi]PKT72289.1 lactate utilization protein C [Streptomyces populi]